MYLKALRVKNNFKRKRKKICRDYMWNIHSTPDTVRVDWNMKSTVSPSVNTTHHRPRKKNKKTYYLQLLSIWSEKINVPTSCAILCNRCILWLTKLKSNCGTGRVKETVVDKRPLCVLYRCDHVLSANDAFGVFVLHCWSVGVPNAVLWVLNKSCHLVEAGFSDDL